MAMARKILTVVRSVSCAGKMAMAKSPVVWPSSSLTSWTRRGVAAPCSLRSGFSNRPFSRCPSSCTRIATVAKLPVHTRQTHLACSPLQTDVPGEETESTEALQKLKDAIDLEGGDSKEADEGELLRFLRAKSFNTEQAAKAFTTHQKWRSEFVPNGYFTEADCLAELGSEKAYWITKNKKDCPAILVLGRNHAYNKQDFNEFKRFVVYTLDRVIRDAPPGVEQLIAIVDLKGLGLKNLDAKSFIAAFDIIQNHYPGRLEKICMVNVPLIFNGVWKVVKSFLNEDTKSKIVFVDKKKLVETLTDDIDLEFLPKEYGGQADLALVQNVKTLNWTPNWPSS